jgi:hypothetical protein
MLYPLRAAYLAADTASFRSLGSGTGLSAWLTDLEDVPAFAELESGAAH